MKNCKAFLISCLLGFELLFTLTGCNLFDNKIQGQIGQSSGAGTGKPQVSDRIGITSEFPEYVFDEGTRQRLKFIMTKAPKDPFTLPWRISGGDNDFQDIAGTVELAAGAESFEIDLTTLNDSLYEGDEKFNLVVDIDEDYFATDVAIPLKITEAAATPPQISFVESARTIKENAGNYTLIANLSQASANLVRVKLSISGTATEDSDFALSPNQDLVFGPGQTSRTVQISVKDDAIANESLEDVTITLTEIVVGSALIDNANKQFTLLIEDNDMGTSPISITGATGGADVTADSFLTAGSRVTVNWAAPTLLDEVSFVITLFEMDGVTIRCPSQTVGADFTTVAFSACALSEGGSYKISVVGNRPDGSAVLAGNNLFVFKVDTLPPEAFNILGVMGGNDIVPDAFLAGALQPTIVWKDTEGESSYSVKVLYSNGTSISVPNCEVTGIPANITSYNFESCNLTAGQPYLVKVSAKDDTGLVTSATDFPFTVTTNSSGYMILGVKGGVSDTTLDENMDDGTEPIVRWQKAFSATDYSVEILTTAMAPIVGCAAQSLDGSYAEVTMVGCDLNLNEDYRLVVRAKISGAWVQAANSPYTFKHRVGLYVSGTGGSYINGQSIKSCGGDGSVCNLASPYEVSTPVKYDKIRISNSGVLTGRAWTGNSPTVGNGILSIETTSLVMDTSGSITMDGRGYTATQGPGAGSSGANGNGASHGGLGGISFGGIQGPVYGDARNPLDLGSGGGNGSFAGNNLGGAGGGSIVISATSLYMNSASISANGAIGQLGQCTGTSCSGGYRNGGGSGSGGSIKILADSFSGTSGKIRAIGGHSTGSASLSAGGGGRIAFEYKQNSYGSFSSLFEAFGNVGIGTPHSESSSAAGTVFYKNVSSTGGDANGHLVVDNNNIVRVQGVETPVPRTVFDSITTTRNGILIVPSTDEYTHFSNTIDFDVVVAGILHLSGSPNDLVVGSLVKTSYFEWRRQDPLAFATITIEKGSVVSHSRNGTTPVYRLVINTTDLTVRGAINASGRGFDLESGPGKASGVYGASHGGLGASGAAGPTNLRSPVYGSLKAPIALGSGGGGYSNLPLNIGRGGGAIEINTTNLFLFGERVSGTKTAGLGEIRADGSTGQSSGGAGGSIWIKADAVQAKDATISVQGGGSSSGAGAGGRISISYKKDDEYLAGAPRSVWSELSTGVVQVTAQGGDGAFDGAAGTIFLQKTATGLDAFDVEPIDTLGHLWVFNGTRDYDESTTTVLAENNLLNSIRTDTSGTILIPSGMSATLPSNEISYRIVSEGDFGPTGNLTIKSAGYLEWRKSSPLIVSGTMTVESNGVLTHSKNGMTRQYIVNVLADNIVIAGKVDASGKGYGKRLGPGAPGSPSWGAAHAGWGADSNTIPTGSGTPYGIENVATPVDLGSGGYATEGGGVIWLQAPSGKITLSGTIDASAPNANSVNLNGQDWGTGSGGSIYIKANQLESTKVTGTSPIINANGGAGGPIVSGGTGRDSYSGSGGRIALDITVDSMTSGGLTQAVLDKNITAIGGRGSGAYGGAAGTIYLKTDKRYLFVDNDGLPYKDRIETPIPTVTLDEINTIGNGTLVVTEGQIYQLSPSDLKGRLVVAGVFSTSDNNLTIKSNGFLQWRRSTPLKLTKLSIENQGVITHTSNFADAQYRFELEVDELDIQAGGKIDVTGKGYQPGAGPGGSGIANAGAAYGGSSRFAAAYGSVTNPLDLGSGGKNRSGGGNVQLRVKEKARIAGEIIADGLGTGYSGSGGTININVWGASPGGVLQIPDNNFKLSAQGGTGSFAESGAGGRIAIHYDSYDGAGGPATLASAVNSTKVLANGGTGSNFWYGAAGTIFYKKATDPKGYFVVKNAGFAGSDERISTPLPNGADFDGTQIDSSSTVEIKMGESANISPNLNYRLILSGTANSGGNLNIQNGGVLEIRRGAVVNDFTSIVIESGGVLTHSANGASQAYWAQLQVTSLDLQSGGKINVDGKGYSSGAGPGAGCGQFGSSRSSGGSYGGMGSPGSTSCIGNTYGSIKNPNEIGSSGGIVPGTNANGGAGGGFVKINAATLTLNGVISANGQEPACPSSGAACGGAGSGGAVNIDVTTLLGANGSIVANGGIKVAEISEMSAGGGGRVSVKVSGANSFPNLPIVARGGSAILAEYPAAAGTIFRANGVLGPANKGDLFISNVDTPLNMNAYTELITNEGFDSITIGGNSSYAAKTAVGVRKGATFDFLNNNLNFPLIRAGNARFPGYSPGVHSGDINIQAGGVLSVSGVELVKYHDIVIQSGGVLTHSPNKFSLTNILNLEVNNLEILSGGKISVNGKGYAGASGLGAGEGTWIKAGGGASFGGLGGASASTSNRGATYGAPLLNSKFLGSGGGTGTNSCMGGAGGGGIYITANSLRLNSGGVIEANGGGGQNTNPYNVTIGCESGGGGSGGAIRLVTTNIFTDTFSNAPQIFARGGGIQLENSNDGKDDGGAGGGGRIYIEYQSSTLSDANISTWLSVSGGGSEVGASATLNGADGTATVSYIGP